MRRPRLISIGIVSIVASVLLVSAPGTAVPRYSGTITGSFGAPVLSGAFLQAGSHEPVQRDNAGTALRSAVDTATITWGGDDCGCSAAASSLTFSGDSFSDVPPGQVFRLGTLTFANGPSGPASLIFGFDMQLSAGDGVAPFTEFVEIISTQNTNVDRIADADVLSFAEFDAPSTLAAFEDASVTAIVYGRIGDDGRLGVTSIALAPGEGQHGCVDEAAVVASSGPCTSGCGDICATIGSAFTQPLCGAEQLPGVLNERIRRATASLDQGASAVNKRKAKRAVRLAMRQLRRSAALAGRAARSQHVSAACAEAIGAAVANAETQATPWLRAGSR
jgi:hypothetical protein